MFSRTSSKARASHKTTRDRVLEFEPLEPRILFAADPVATVENLPAEEMVNEEISFDIQFDNQGDATGFKPYVDFTASPEMQITSVETYGQAGSNPGGASLTPIGEINANGDLIQVGSMDALNPSGIAVDHPEYTGNPAFSFGTIGSGTPPVQYNVVGNPSLVGQYVYSVSLPFGSYSQDNPPVSVNVKATINTADGVVPNQLLDVFAQGGFAYGADALNNPATDTPLSGALSSSTIDPQVIALVKTASVPEEDGVLTGENASGPNHPLTYTLTVDVANLEDITGLVITDTLPDDLAYLGNLVVKDGAGTTLVAGVDYTINSEPNVTVDGISAVNSATDTLSITMTGAFTGVAGSDIVITYETFVPYVESDGSTLVVDPITGDQGDLDPNEYNDAAVSGTYDHPSPLIGPVTVTDNGGPMNAGDPNGQTDYRIEEHSLAIQKSVALAKDNNATGLSPFDVLEYTMNFQLSDYFAVDDLVITDVLGDGQEFLFGTGVDPDGIIPELTFQMQGVSITVDFDPGNAVAVFDALTGKTTITFDVYQQLIDSGYIPANGGGTGVGGALQAGDALLGAFIPVGGLGGAAMGSFNAGAPTLGTMKFRAKVLNEYTNSGTGQPEVSEGDSVGNDVLIEAQNLDVDTLAVIGALKDDDSAASSKMGVGQLKKSVYAITNRAGVTTLIAGGTLPANIQLSVGDVITYRITYDLPLSEFEQLTFKDFLPQPTFDVSQIDVSGVFAYEAPTSPLLQGYATAGRISFGQGDTFFGSGGPTDTSDGGIDDATGSYPAVPVPTIDKVLFAGSNGVVITVGDYSTLTEDPKTTKIEFLISVEVEDGVFADGLLFTNQVGATESNTFAEAETGESIAGSQITAPELVITKGVVATDKVSAVFSAPKGPAGVNFNAPGSGPAFSGTINSAGLAATPIDSDITGLDGGDLVTFVILVENLGSGQYGAFDVSVQDTLPGSFALSGAGVQNINLRVTDGNGAALAFTGDLFAGTFQLTDPSANQGSLEAYDLNDGKNLVVIAYDLVVDTDAEARSLITNTATLSNYAAVESGTDYTPDRLSIPGDPFSPLIVGPTDDASATIVGPQINKVLVGTEITDTGNNAADQAVVGELVTYRVTLTIPEGTTVGAVLQDTMDDGLAFVDIVSVTASAGLTVPNMPGTGSNPANVVVGNANGGTGNRLTMNLGDIVNSNTDEAATETLVIEYRAVVLNTNTVPSSPGNQSGTQLNNTAQLDFTWTDDTIAIPPTTGADFVSNGSANVTVVEPNLTVDKQVSGDNSSYSDLLTGVDAGDDVFYRIRITNASGAPTAFDTVLQDTLPLLANVGTIVSVSGGTFTAADFQIVGNVLSTVSSIDIAANTTVEIVVQGQLGVLVQPNQLLQNTANITWTSIDGAPGTRSVHNANSTERGGADGEGTDASTLNNYADSDGADVRITVPLNFKSIVATSEDFTSVVAGTERVAVGEIVRYRLQIEVPEGSASNVQILDRLRPGMVFINDGTATVGFVSSGNDISSSTFGTSPNVGNAIVSPTFVLPDAAVSRFSGSNNDNYNSGTDVRFKLGDLTNNNTVDASPEYIIIEFNALVLNTANTGNQSGTIIRNDFQTRINGNTQVGLTSNQANVRVAEPNLAITKTASTTGPVDAGDTFTYTVAITNNASGANAAPAFDVRLLDVLDEIKAGNPTLELELVNPPTGVLAGFVGNDVSIAGLGTTTVLTNAATTAGLDLTFNRINAGQTLTLTVTVRVVTGALAGAEIENTATVSYTSLPGASGTSSAAIAATYGTTDVDLNPGADSVLADADANNGTVNLGANAGERTGADVPNPTDNTAPADNTTRNNYAVAASSPANLTIAVPTIDKTFQDGSISADDSTVDSSTGSNLVVGEQIIYDILVTLPEGTTTNVRVEDVLPAGLRIDGFSIITTAAGGSSLVTANFDGSITTTPGTSSLSGPGTLAMDFDDISVNVGAVASNANQFVIRVTATVINVIGNQQNITRANTARLVFEDPDRASNSANTPGDITITDPTNNTTITVVEPTLAIVKSVDTAAADAGDTLKYTITVSNNSGQVAYDSKLQDILDANLDGTSAAVLVAGFSATGFGTFTAPTAADFEVVQVTAGNIGEFTSAVTVGDYVLRVNPAFDLDIPDGASVTLDFEATVDVSLIAGTVINNKGDVSWTSTDGANVDERNGTSDPDPGGSQSGNLNNYAIASTVQTTVDNPTVVSKVVTATSDANTTGLDVTIGEIVTYRIAISLPEGTTPELVLTDQLPVGLAYIPGSAALTAFRPGAPALNAAHPGTGTAVFNGTYNGAALDTPDMVISPVVALDGTDITFTFDQTFVVAPDNDVSNNTFYFTYQVVVTDNPGTTGLQGSQDSLDNNIQYQIKDFGGAVTDSGTGLTDPAGKIVDVIEPDLNALKSVVVNGAGNSGDAGDPVVYTILIDHDANSLFNAYDLTFADTLPAQIGDSSTTALTMAGVTVTHSVLGDVTAQFELVAGVLQTTAAADIDLDLGETLTVTVNGVLLQTVPPGTSFDNQASFTYTNRDGDFTATGGYDPSPDITTDRERTVSENSNVVTVNVPSALVLTKALISTSETGANDTTGNDLAIGETAVYRLGVTLQDGTTSVVTLTDTTPAGMRYVAGGGGSGVFFRSADGIVATGFNSNTVYNDGDEIAAADLTDSTSDTVAGSLIFRFKEVVVPATAGIDTDAFQIEYTMRAVNVIGNQTGVARQNSAVVSADRNGDGDHTDPGETTGPQTVTANIVEPVMTLVKAAVGAPGSLANLDAGDTIQYTLTFSNTGTSAAQDLLLTDTVPAGLSIQSIDSVALTGGAIQDVAATITGGVNLSGEYTVPVGGQVVVTYTVLLDNTVTPGTNYTNGAQIVWTSLDGGSSFERDGTDGPQGGGTLNDYRLTDSVTAVTDTTFDLVKSVDKTTATIGEVLTYTLTLTLNEGTTNNVVLVDTLPVDSGVLQLEFLTGTQTIAYGTAGTTISGSGTPVVSGGVNQTLTFNLGNVVLPSNAAADTITITYQVVVKNVLTNQAGDVETNTASGSATGVTPDTGNTTDVTLVEPQLTIDKVVATPGSDAGDTVVYTLTISNAAGPNSSTAYDINVTDALDAALALIDVTLGSGIVVSGATVASNSSTTTNLDLVLQQLAAGSSATITLNATLNASVVSGDTVENTGSITYTSLTGTPPEERNGTDGAGNVLNNYVDTDPANFILATPTIDKITPSDTTYAIGESVTWDILVTLPEGVTQDLVVSDFLPANLAYESFTVVTSAAASGGLLSNDFAGTVTSSPTVANPSGNTRTFNFGNVTTTDDNAANNNTFLLRVTSRVENVQANQGAGSPGAVTQFNNTASLVYTDGTNGSTTVTDPTAPGPVDVVEPILSLDKVAITATTGLDAGDTIQYSVTFENTGTSIAQDLVFTDVLPSGLTVQSIDSTVITGGATTDIAVSGVGTGNLSGEFTVPVGGKVVVTYTVVLDNTVTPGTDYTNGAQIVWSSLNGVNINERTGTDGLQSGTTLNNYQLTDSVTASTDTTFDLVKSVDKATATIGEVLTYTLTLTLNEGTTNNVVLVDTLPVDSGVLQLEFLTGTETISYATSGTTISGTQTPVVTGGVNQTLTFNLGSVVLPSDAAADTVTITYQVVVKNVLTNQAGDVETNTASGSATGVTPDTNNTTDVTLLEPQLTMVKVTTTPGTDAGDAVVYTITVTNAAGPNASTAYDINVLDALDASIELIDVTLGSGIVVSGATVAANTSTTGNLNLVLDQLAAGSSATITINAKVKASAVSGATITNTGSLTYTSLTGTPPEERNGTDGPGNVLNNYATSDGSNPFILATPTIDKVTPSDTTYAIGESVTWDILVTLPEGVTQDLVVSDFLPANLAYESFVVVTSAAASGGLLSNDFAGTVTSTPTVANPSGNTRTFNFGNVTTTDDNAANNNTFLLRVTSRVENVQANQGAGSPGAVTQFNNTASLVYTDGTNGSTTVTDPTAPGPVDVVEPILSLDKVAITATTGLDAGDTIQYSVTFENTGTSIAQDLVFTDVLPSGLTVQSIDSTVITGGATTDVAVSGVGTGNLSGEFTVPVGGKVVVTYTVVLDNTVTPGTDYTNGAQIVWSSLNGVNTNERTGTDGLQSGTMLNNYQLIDSVTASTDTTFDLVKSVNKTQATIGEVLTYTLTLTLNEGTTNNVVLTDLLPLDAGVLQLGFVTGTAAISYGTAGTTISGSVTPVVSGAVNETLTFTLGNVVLPANASPNTVIVTYDAVVLNVLTNQAGDVETNTASGTATGVTPDTGNTTDITIVEPAITVAKTTTSVPANPDAGDTLGYQVIVTSSGSVDAFDVTFSDVLPAELSLQTGTFTATRDSDSGDVSGFFTVTTTGVVNVAGGFDLVAGDFITITYDATILSTVTDGLNLTNSVGVEWTSLDGSVTGERTGDGNPNNTPVPGALNNYEVVDTATVVANLSPVYALSKVVTATSAPHTGVADGTSPTITDLVIGEEVTYQITVTMGQGTTQGVSVADVMALTNGILDIRSVTVANVGSNLTLGSQIIAITDSNADTYADQFTVTFGTVVNDASSAVAAEGQIVIEVKAVVVNVLANQDGDVINNQATLTYREDNNGDGNVTGPGDVSTISDNVDVEIVEPVLDVTKSITAQPLTPNAGEVVAYQIVINNSGPIDGFDLTFIDQLPPQMDLREGSGSYPNSFTATRDSDGADVSAFFTVNTGGITNVAGGFDLVGGDFITITYDAVILPTVTDGQLLINRVDLEWTSLNGGNLDERTGDGSPFVTSGPLNNYENETNAFIVADLQPAYGFTKEIVSTSAAHTGITGGTDATITDLVIGETVTYRLTVNMANGTSLAVQIVDILDLANGILDIRNVNVTLGSNLTSQTVAQNLLDSNGDTYIDQLAVNFGTVVNNVASTLPADSQIVIDVTAVVVNISANQDGDVINNEAIFSVLADLDNGGVPNDLLQITSDVDVEIIEPVLDVTKTVDNTQPQLGDTLTYTLVVTNQAGANRTDAFDVQIIDTLPTGLVMDPGSVSLNIIGTPANPSSIIANTSTATGISVLLDRLDEGESVEIVYNVIVTSDITFFDAVLVNTVDMTYTSLPDGNGNINGDERGGTTDPLDPNNYIDNAQESVEIFQPDVEIVKTIDAGGEVISPLEVFSYTLDVVSVGRADALNVVVTDDISYMLANGFVFVTADNGGFLNGSVVTWNLGDMQGDPVMDTAQLSFTMQAPRFLPAGFNALPNTVEAKHDDIDPTPENNIDKVQSIVSIPPRPIPPEPDKPIEPTDPDPFAGLAFDLNQNFLFERGNLTGPGDFWSQQLNKHLAEPKVEAVQAGYIVSGLTQPGTSVKLVVYNARGEVIGTQATLADTGGNWMATFNSSKVGEIPARVVIQQTPATQNAGADSGYDLRTYFAPASATGTYYTENLSPENVMRKRMPEAVVDLYHAAGSTIRLSWNGSSYEFATQGGQVNGSGN